MGAEDELRYAPHVPDKGAQKMPRARVPQLDGRISAAGRAHAPVGAEGDRHNHIRVPGLHDQFGLTCLSVRLCVAEQEREGERRKDLHGLYLTLFIN